MRRKGGKLTFRQQMRLTALPGMLGVGFLYLLPGCALFYYASINNVFQKRFVGLENLLDILSNSYFLLALKNTAVLLAAALALVLLLAILLVLPNAFFGWRTEGVAIVLLIPLFTPSVISVELLQNVGGGLPSRWQLLLLFVWRNAGAILLLLSVGMARMEKDMLEAARLDGANRWQLFVYMQFPMLTLYIGVGAVFLVMQFFGIFREAYLLFETSFPPDEVYLLQHYMHNHFLRLNYPYLAAAAILFTAFLVAVIWVVRVLTTRFIKYRHFIGCEYKMSEGGRG